MLNRGDQVGNVWFGNTLMLKLESKFVKFVEVLEKKMWSGERTFLEHQWKNAKRD